MVYGLIILVVSMAERGEELYLLPTILSFRFSFFIFLSYLTERECHQIFPILLARGKIFAPTVCDLLT
jgi:hypothetical protein